MEPEPVGIEPWVMAFNVHVGIRVVSISRQGASENTRQIYKYGKCGESIQ
jgi:hypothetical protein